MQTVPEGTEGAKSRTNKTGKTVWELSYSGLKGIVTNLEIKDTDYGKQMEVSMVDGKEKYCLTIPVQSSFFSHFAGKVGNVNLDKLVEIKPFKLYSDQKNRDIAGLNFYQDGKVAWFISKENQPKDYPEYPTGKGESEFKIWQIKKSEWEINYIKTFKFELTADEVSEELGKAFAEKGDDEVPF